MMTRRVQLLIDEPRYRYTAFESVEGIERIDPVAAAAAILRDR